MIRVSFGDVEIDTGEQSYIFRPSFRNCLKLGTPKEVVETFGQLHMLQLEPYIKTNMANQALKFVSKRVLPNAYLILDSCCDTDPSRLIGTYNGTKYRPGLMSFENIITIAKHLIKHMVIGEPKPSEQKGDDFSNEFDAVKMVDAAVIHLGLDEEKALELSMTRFQHMIELKFPQEKPAYPTDQEYDDCMEWLEQVNEARD